MFSNALPPGLKAFAEREFLGERVVWTGQPHPRRSTVAACEKWPFAVIWIFLSMAAFGDPVAKLFRFLMSADGAASKGTEAAALWAPALLSLPFLLISVGFLLHPFYVFWRSHRTLYVLSRRRLALLQGDTIVTITSITPSDIAAIRRMQGADGYGTLIIEHGLKRDSESRDPLSKQARVGVIGDVRGVDELVQELKERGAG